jgi:3-methyladenine DNA glycosylase AlkC
MVFRPDVSFTETIVITKIDDIKPLLLEARSNPTRVLPRLRSLAASKSWQEREVAATALVDLAKLHPEPVLSAAIEWATARDANVRRAASEGLRGLVQRDPERVRPVLEALREDEDAYVKKSVANVLRNATRTQPDFVLRVCAEWARSANPHTRWIVRDGLRKMKTTHPQKAERILELLGPSFRAGTDRGGRNQRQRLTSEESSMTSTPTVAAHFTKAAAPVRETYDTVLAAARTLGPVREEAKKTSIHLVRSSAFAGIATRSKGLVLTLKAAKKVRSARVRRAEQISANRWHLEIPLATPDDVDAELRTWLQQAYELA